MLYMFLLLFLFILFLFSIRITNADEMGTRLGLV